MTSDEEHAVLEIRPAVTEDALEIAHLRSRSMLARYGALVADLNDVRLPEVAADVLAQELGKEPSRRRAMLCVESGRLLGYGLYGPQSDPRRPEPGELFELYVAPERARQGIGRRLMLAIAADAQLRGWQPLLAWAWVSNREAHKFYLAIGAEACGQRAYERNGKRVRELGFSLSSASAALR